MSALFTDFYELTMAQGYFAKGLFKKSVFDLFFRRQPFGGGYAICAGLETFLQDLQNFRFSNDDIEYLRTQKIFTQAFLEYLKNFKFNGDIWAIPEGSIIFPQVPLVRVHADLIEAQIIEGLVLNHINFQSLIATKTARMYHASKAGSILEFGLRRAQGSNGAIVASRAAFIGGAQATSNTLAGKMFDIPVRGTMAHSWIMSYTSELEAFEIYAELYPEHSVFLIDTYDTLGSGIKNAIIVGKKLQAKGYNFGVRLDSGDITYLTRQVRKALDTAGCKGATITVSNDLDENIIEHLMSEDVPVNQWGIGTQLVTAGGDSAFTGVYKLAALERAQGLEATMKISDNPEKASNPGIKNVYRLYDADDYALGDIICLESEGAPEPNKPLTLYHPSGDWRRSTVTPARVEALLKQVLCKGELVTQLPNLRDIQARVKAQIKHFDATYLRLLNPHGYKVSLSRELRDMKLSFIKGMTEGM